MKARKLNSKGFTLIELLIVIIIIGILATIGFVAYSGAQNKAKKADAQSTLSQVKSQLAAYNADKASYPASKADITTYLNSNHNDSMATTFGDTGYTYTATPSGCDGTSTNACTGFTLTASKSLFSGDTDITVGN